MPGAGAGRGDALRTLSTLKDRSRGSGPNLTGLAPRAAGGMRRRPSRGSADFGALSAKMAVGRGGTGPRSLFRSEDMLLVRLYLDRAAAHATIDALGDLGACQFNDLNASQSAFQRAFSNNVRRCDEMLRVTRFLADQTERVAHLKLTPPPEKLGASSTANLRLDDLDAHLQSLERALLELNANEEALTIQYNQTCELRAVLDKCAVFFRDAPRPVAGRSSVHVASAFEHHAPFLMKVASEFAALSETPSISVGNVAFSEESALSQFPNDYMGGDAFAEKAGDGALGKTGLLSFMTGTLVRDKVPAFERMLFRATHGNCFVRFADLLEPLVDPETEMVMHKSVFMVFFAGVAVKAKITKICDSFAANRYSIPEHHDMQMNALDQSASRLSELKAVAKVTGDQRKQILLDVSENLNAWRLKIKREMSVFHTLNLFNYDTSSRLFIAEAWCPVSLESRVREALEVGRHGSNAQVASVLEIRKPEPGVAPPPTHFETNKFTTVFQSIVESYGVAKYQEVNPAPYTIITFPFLFAVMFGDIGHGIVMAAFAAYLVVNETRFQATRRKLNEMMVTCFDGRYLILLMGLFSIYTGFIYNEFFAVPIDLFGSRWKYTASSVMACGIDNCDVPGEVLPPLSPYPFGFDPVWKASKTGLVFFNSFKMKLSIVLGVCQMVMGICLSYSNAKFFRQPIDTWFVFVPQLGFMLSIFGYLVALIFIKWTSDFNAPECVANPDCLAPDLKSVLIGMVMSPGSMPESSTMFAGQNGLQVILLGVAVICVPWMLLPKPLILRARHNRRKGAYQHLGSEDTEGGDGDQVDEPFSFGDVFVHQMIHTIEFVLGAVSNTASYLRLWALSLAHAVRSKRERVYFPSGFGGFVCFFCS
jgi:V-type H+-transporting ATPase subunit a